MAEKHLQSRYAPDLMAGQVALVTGSGSGMGRSHARLMAERGADVIVHDVDAQGANETAAMVREGGGKAAVMAVDIPAAPDPTTTMS